MSSLPDETPLGYHLQRFLSLIEPITSATFSIDEPVPTIREVYSSLAGQRGELGLARINDTVSCLSGAGDRLLASARGK